MSDKLFSGWDSEMNRIECSTGKEEDKDTVVKAFRKNKKVVKITMAGHTIWRR